MHLKQDLTLNISYHSSNIIRIRKFVYNASRIKFTKTADISYAVNYLFEASGIVN